MRLLIVRHGQSTWNALGRWQGTEDPPLSPLGEAQAHCAADALATVAAESDLAFDAVFASDLQRATATGAALGTGLGLDGITLVGGLRERFAGPWQGLTRAEIEDDWPGWLADGRRPDDYEPDEALNVRSGAAIAEMRATGAHTAVAVSHAGVLMALERAAGHAPERFPNLAGRWFDVGDATLHCGERIELVPEGVDLGVE